MSTQGENWNRRKSKQFILWRKKQAQRGKWLTQIDTFGGKANTSIQVS